MYSFKSILCVALLLTATNIAAAKESRDEKQHRLDSACEVVRQRKLAPLRAQFVDECVANKEMPNRKECERFYSDYGNRTGRRAPLFYDLPECVTAFDYLQSAQPSGG
jgi:hypothetical protein